MRHLLWSTAGMAVVLTAAALPARVIGTMQPFASLTAARVESLPPAEAKAWRAYLDRSVAAMARDKAALAAERSPGAAIPAPPPEAGKAGNGMPLDRPAAWYATPQARAVADNIVSFQTPAGGWGKNQDRSGPARVPGQSFIDADARAGRYAAQDGAADWSFVGTIDNDATTTELAFLARVQAQLPGAEGGRYRAAFLRGLAYLFDAEFPGGGWPQVYPLQGGYHDALTLNDDAMTNVMTLLERVAGGGGDFAFVPAATRARAAASVARGMDVLLRAQVVVDGKRTIWAQQYDPITLAPVGARNFEPVALSTGESAHVVEYLKRQTSQVPRRQQAVAAAADWFRTHALRGVVWTTEPRSPEGRRLVIAPDAPPIWARFYDPASGKPIYGDRDRAIRDDVNEVSLERRNGYAWFNRSGEAVARATGGVPTER